MFSQTISWFGKGREGKVPPPKNVILGKIPKERTPPNQPAGLTGDQKFHEKIICLERSNMPYKHDIVFSLKSLGLLTPSPPPTHSLGIFPIFFRGGGTFPKLRGRKKGPILTIQLFEFLFCWKLWQDWYLICFGSIFQVCCWTQFPTLALVTPSSAVMVRGPKT